MECEHIRRAECASVAHIHTVSPATVSLRGTEYVWPGHTPHDTTRFDIPLPAKYISMVYFIYECIGNKFQHNKRLSHRLHRPHLLLFLLLPPPNVSPMSFVGSPFLRVSSLALSLSPFYMLHFASVFYPSLSIFLNKCQIKGYKREKQQQQQQ